MPCGIRDNANFKGGQRMCDVRVHTVHGEGLAEMVITKKILDELTEKAKASPRL